MPLTPLDQLGLDPGDAPLWVERILLIAVFFFIAWIVYAAYLHARATAGWRGVPSAWINVAVLAVMIFNLFFINIVISGLHSYSGL